jgi:hypothetical protein
VAVEGREVEAGGLVGDWRLEKALEKSAEPLFVLHIVQVKIAIKLFAILSFFKCKLINCSRGVNHTHFTRVKVFNICDI